eukprot:96794-Rhodomonas_salina.1
MRSHNPGYHTQNPERETARLSPKFPIPSPNMLALRPPFCPWDHHTRRQYRTWHSECVAAYPISVPEMT